MIFLSTALTLTAAQILEIYSSRFSIELAIRDLKQHFGLGDYQGYLGIAIDRFVHLACVAYCVCTLIPNTTIGIGLDAQSFCFQFSFKFFPSSSRTPTFGAR